MISTRKLQAAVDPRSRRRVFGVSSREVRLMARKLILGTLAASPIPGWWMNHAGSAGLILCLHNIVERHGPLGSNRGLDLTIDELSAVLDFLKSHGYRPVALQTLFSSRASASSERNFTVTFDDGYAGNLHFAHPMLTDRGIPYTIYVTTGYMDQSVCVWWYALERLLARTERLGFDCAGRTFDLDTSTLERKIAADRSIRGLLTAHPAFGDNLLRQVFNLKAGPTSSIGVDDVLAAEQIHKLSDDPLVTIGAHTVTHPILRELSNEEARREIRQCRSRLEAVTGKAVVHFAYPFGSHAVFGMREEQMVQEAGYVTATTTRPRGVKANDRPTALPRVMLTAEMNVIASLKALMTGWFGRR